VSEVDIDVEAIQARRASRRAEARTRLGVLGPRATGDLPPLRELVSKHRLSWYPLIALGLVAVGDTLQRFGFTVLTPDISRTLGISKGTIAGVIAIQGLATALLPLPLAAAVQGSRRRAQVVVGMGVLAGVFAVATGVVTSVWGLVAVLMVGGLGIATTHTLHHPLLFDIYPPEARVRVLTRHQGFESAGNVIGPLLVAVLVGWAALTWRGVFVAMGIITIALCLVAIRLRDPGIGRWDEKMIRRTVHDDEPGGLDESQAPDARAPEVESSAVELGFFEITRRLLLIPTVRRVLAGYALLGILFVPYQTFLFFFLAERWELGAGERGLFFAGAHTASIVSLMVFGPLAERSFRQDPARGTRFAGLVLGVGVGFICLGGISEWFPLTVVLFVLAQATLALLRPSLAPALLGVIPSYMRPHAAALSGVFIAGVGGLFGALFLTGIDSRFGVAAAMVSMLIPGVAGGAVIASAGRFVSDDLDRMIEEVLEDEEINVLRASGAKLPLLSCRSIDFSYGQLQVLFDVDFTVDDGEMIALLGVNGAGKSTLLRVISGLGLPQAGTVRFRGADITFLDPERRVLLGINQIAGGKAVFGPLTVAENLRSMGHTVSDRKALSRSIDECYEAFPRLAERKDQAARTLSGGEQQMLALSKALILRPQLLIIDELSLGLAPVVVEQLLGMVRRINAQGTAVVLVEQSVNVALNLADHAYFMEKGQVRFDGASHELLHRSDLLRAVFLDGAEKGNGRG